MRRMFWFAVGVGVAVVVVMKGREWYEKLTPRGVAARVEKARAGLVDRVSGFVATVGDAMSEREAELRDAVGMN